MPKFTNGIHAGSFLLTNVKNKLFYNEISRLFNDSFEIKKKTKWSKDIIINVRNDLKNES